jgi:outer membrane protein assembly factor BamD
MHDIHVADYYYRRGAYVASLNRAQWVLKEFPKTPATERALVIMVNSYERLGMNGLRDDAKRVLDKTYPGSKEQIATSMVKLPWWKFWR